MIVLWNGKLWQLDMSYKMYQLFIENSPQKVVKLLEITSSNYKKQEKVPIGETTDELILIGILLFG